jgi:carboxyl-terminal processing protease
MKRYSRLALLVLIMFFLCSVTVRNRFPGGMALAQEKNVYKSLDILCDVISIIQRDYIERISSDTLVNNALRGMLASLDNYSHFSPAGEKKQETEAETETEELETYGLEVAHKDRLMTVVSPIENGPAYKAGLKPGDIIIKINEEAVTERPLAELMLPFRGRATEELKLKVLRRGERDFIETVLKPGRIEGPPVRSEGLGENVGLLRVNRFNKDTAVMTAEALNKSRQEGNDSLVIDLRDCPSGKIASAIAVADQFLPVGEEIASVNGRAKGVERKFLSKEKPLFGEGPVVVLINGGTSGAAEVLAGALQSQRKAVLMGQNSFGSAFEEGTFAMKDGSSINIITGVYQTPAGKVIQDKGIEADIKVESEPPVSEEKVEEKKSDNEKQSEEKEKEKELPDSLIQRSVDLIKAIRLTKIR